MLLDYPIVEEYTTNGLRVVLSPDPTSPAVAVNLWYRVGSADEPVGTKGFAHLFEHLMFQGSAGMAPSEHLALMQSLGGSANATTSFDRTNYFETVPPHALELALWAEADRLASLDVSQTNLDTQRQVVQEEKRQRYDNVPYGDQLRLMLELNFPEGHPYSVPTIGLDSDLEAAELDHVRSFHRDWYRPELATLVLAGQFEVEPTLALVEHYFGDIVPGEGARGQLVQADPLPPHRDVPMNHVFRDVPRAMVHLVWRTPPATHVDHPAVLIALAVLGAGQSSRLHLELVRTGLAEASGAHDFALTRGSSLGLMTARRGEAGELTQLDDLICAQISDLAANGPRDEELGRVWANTEREWLSHLSLVGNRSDTINEFTTLFNDPHLVNAWLQRVAAVTADDVTRVCDTWLHPDKRAILTYRPHAEADLSSSPGNVEEGRR